jgi:putative transcriptional regulator
MDIQPGTLLNSASLDGSNFDKAVIYLTEYTANGAVGFVINKPFSCNLNELAEFNYSIPFPLYDGGPVDKEHLFFIHRRPDLIEGGTFIAGSTYLGGDFKQAVSSINNRQLTEKDIQLFIGYCGWDDQQLEEEIAEGSWEIREEEYKDFIR